MAKPAPPPLWLLVTIMFTSQFAVTIFLPSLPSMETALGTSQAAVKLTVSVYLGSFALAQLVWPNKCKNTHCLVLAFDRNQIELEIGKIWR